MKENPYLLSYRLTSVSSIAEVTTDCGQITAVPFQDDAKQNPAEDGDEFVIFPLPTQEKIDEQEPDETSEEEDEDEEDEGLANVWLN